MEIDEAAEMAILFETYIVYRNTTNTVNQSLFWFVAKIK